MVYIHISVFANSSGIAVHGAAILLIGRRVFFAVLDVRRPGFFFFFFWTFGIIGRYRAGDRSIVVVKSVRDAGARQYYYYCCCYLYY